MIDEKTLRDAAARLGVLPQSLQRLSAVTATPDFEFSDVVEVVAHDMTLATGVLKVANSAANAPPDGVPTVRDAVLRIGVAGTLAAAMHTIASVPLQRGLPAYDLAPGQMWRHACAASIAAEHVQAASSVVLPISYGTTALLHDVGKLVLDSIVATTPRLRGTRLRGHGPALCEAELERFGVHHGEAGAVVAEQWYLPGAVVEGVRRHHDPVGDVLPAAVGLADVVSDAVLDGRTVVTGHDGWNADIARQVLGIPRDRMERIVAGTEERLGALLQRFEPVG
jgi:HD-like signal output (HDOD) protein